jgi:XRE family transcriptional regulator, regulator of sulfur utilization
MPRARLALLALSVSFATLSGRSADAPILHSKTVTWEDIEKLPTSNNGRSRALLLSRTATVDELDVHVTVLQPGEASHPPHRHPAEELILVRDGTVEFSLEGRKQRVGPGGLAFLASNEEHNATNVGDKPSFYYVIQWKSPSAPPAAAK